MHFCFKRGKCIDYKKSLSNAFKSIDFVSSCDQNGKITALTESMILIQLKRVQKSGTKYCRSLWLLSD